MIVVGKAQLALGALSDDIPVGTWRSIAADTTLLEEILSCIGTSLSILRPYIEVGMSGTRLPL